MPPHGQWPQTVWPRLRMISCWTDGVAEPWTSELAACFPRVAIQGKGLTATEGMVSFPLGRSGKKVCAVRSHFLEFIDPESGKIHHAWDVEAGKEYTVILTTGGGLYRYRLHDLVRVTSFFNQAPCLSFISRDNLVSDMVGEKLNARHVEETLRRVEKELGHRFLFAMLAPVQDGPRAGYALYAQPAGNAEPDFQRAAALLEIELCRNFHYRHARRMSQLEPARDLSHCREGRGSISPSSYRKRDETRRYQVPGAFLSTMPGRPNSPGSTLPDGLMSARLPSAIPNAR